jgi:hypothetical protein
MTSMTHHMVEKLYSHYGAVATKSACKVMAGFNLDEAYFVPRSSIPLGEGRDAFYYLRLLLPEYDTWVNQIASPRGDNTSAGRKFLYQTLPWLAETVVQDGCFFVNDFPNHSFSRLLHDRIPGYERFAQSSRRWVTERETERPTNRIAALNCTTLNVDESDCCEIIVRLKERELFLQVVLEQDPLGA